MNSSRLRRIKRQLRALRFYPSERRVKGTFGEIVFAQGPVGGAVIATCEAEPLASGQMMCRLWMINRPP